MRTGRNPIRDNTVQKNEQVACLRPVDLVVWVLSVCLVLSCLVCDQKIEWLDCDTREWGGELVGDTNASFLFLWDTSHAFSRF